MDEVDDFRRLIGECARKLGKVPVPSDISAITQELIRLDVRTEERQRAVEEPFSSELTQEVEAVMGTFDTGTVETLRILLKFGELTERTAGDKVRQSSKYTNQTMFLIGIETRTGWLIKTQSSPFPNVSRDEDRYIISPRIKPYLVAWFERHA